MIILFDVQVVHQRVSNTIKLYAKQRRLMKQPRLESSK